jgi:hypothetical protein
LPSLPNSMPRGSLIPSGPAKLPRNAPDVPSYSNTRLSGGLTTSRLPLGAHRIPAGSSRLLDEKTSMKPPVTPSNWNTAPLLKPPTYRFPSGPNSSELGPEMLLTASSANTSMNAPVTPSYRSTWFVSKLDTYRFPSGPNVSPAGLVSPLPDAKTWTKSPVPLFAAAPTSTDARISSVDIAPRPSAPTVHSPRTSSYEPCPIESTCTNVTPGGSWSSTTTPVAPDGPSFVTVTV